MLIGALAVLTLALASGPAQEPVAREEAGQPPSPEEVRELRRQEYLRLAEEQNRDFSARMARIPCRRFPSIEGVLRPADHLEWSLDAGMAVPLSRASWHTPFPFLIARVGWVLWNPIWDCGPPTREELESVGLGPPLTIDWGPSPHHQLSLSLGADAIANLQGARFGPLARIGFGYRQGGHRYAPFIAARLAAGPTFGTGGTGWSVSLALSVLALEATVRFERAPDASFLLLSLGVHDLHRY